MANEYENSLIISINQHKLLEAILAICLNRNDISKNASVEERALVLKLDTTGSDLPVKCQLCDTEQVV